MCNNARQCGVNGGAILVSRDQYESAKVIKLQGVEPFASGDNRLCFRHPENPARCIKVVKQGRARSLRMASPLYKRVLMDSHFDDNRREYDAYQQPAITKGVVPYDRHIARCYGWVETSHGEGLVTDFIADVNGKPAQTLETYLAENGLDDLILECVSTFSEFLRASLVLTKNLMPHNLVLAEGEGGYRLVLIDGLGLSTVLPLAKHFAFFARRHVEKRIQWFNFRLDWEVSDRSVSWRDTESRFRFIGAIPIKRKAEF